MRLSRRGGIHSGRWQVAAGYAAEVMADSPLAYWRLEETSGSTVSDETGNGYMGTVVGADLTVSGKVGSGVGFDGVDDYVDVSKLGTLTSGFDTTPEMTFEYLVRFSGTAGGFTFGTVDDGGNAIIQAMINRNGAEQAQAGAMSFSVFDDSRVRLANGTSGTYNDGEWHHFAAVWNGSSMDIYADGSLDNGILFEGTPSNWGLVDYPFLLGGRNFRGSVQSGSAHDMDEVAVYDYPLSAARILAHAQAAGVT